MHWAWIRTRLYKGDCQHWIVPMFVSERGGVRQSQWLSETLLPLTSIKSQSAIVTAKNEWHWISRLGRLSKLKLVPTAKFKSFTYMCTVYTIWGNVNMQPDVHLCVCACMCTNCWRIKNTKKSEFCEITTASIRRNSLKSKKTTLM